MQTTSKWTPFMSRVYVILKPRYNSGYTYNASQHSAADGDYLVCTRQYAKLYPELSQEPYEQAQPENGLATQLQNHEAASLRKDIKEIRLCIRSFDSTIIYTRL